MNERFEEMNEYLRRLSVWARHASDQAEAKIREVNTWARQLGELGFLNDTVILGPVILSRGYEPRPGGNDSGQLVQAALYVPRGFGVVYWDSEEYVELYPVVDTLESEALHRLEPFEDREPAIKGLLLPHVEPLLEKLYRRLPQ
jgi:hypothetical protein